jgi:hypothetical protein
MQDAARKALEAALGEKKDAFSKWDEEIKKRQESGGGGGGRGRGWGSGGGGGVGGGGDSSGGGLPRMPSNSWDEAKQMVLAFMGLTALVSSTGTLTTLHHHVASLLIIVLMTILVRMRIVCMYESLTTFGVFWWGTVLGVDAGEKHVGCFCELSSVCFAWIQEVWIVVLHQPTTSLF